MSPVSQRWIDLGSQAAMPYCVAKGMFLISIMSLDIESFTIKRHNISAFENIQLHYFLT